MMIVMVSFVAEAAGGLVLARIVHRGIEQRSGERVRRLEITQPNEHATHRFFEDRL
jgi:hypothetical protein